MIPQHRMRLHSLAALALALTVVSLARQSRGQAGLPLWTNTCSGNATAIAVDLSGNVIVTGSSTGNLAYTTIKYTGGGVPLWTNGYSGPAGGFNYAFAVVADADGNVVVSGESGIASGGTDLATIKYSGAGVPIWTNRFHGPSTNWDFFGALLIDSSNNVIVAGSDDINRTNTGLDYVTIKYSNGGVPLWTNRYNGPANGGDFLQGAAVDGNNNVIVTGYSFFGGSSAWAYTTVKYSSAGAPLWTNRYGVTTDISVGTPHPRPIAVDRSNNVIVTVLLMDLPSHQQWSTLMYSDSGPPLWTNTFAMPQGIIHYPHNPGVALDSSGGVFVSGTISNGASGYDYKTIAYSAAGAPRWTNQFNGPTNGEDYFSWIATDNRGNVYVTGASTGTGTAHDYATIAYSGAGLALWTNRYNGPANKDDLANALVIDANGNVLVTGYSPDATNSRFATIKYSPSPPRPDYLGFACLNQQLVLTWANPAFDLQSALDITGTFTNIPGATSPHTNSMSASRQFFRLISN
jgi:hypothetical protein